MYHSRQNDICSRWPFFLTIAVVIGTFLCLTVPVAAQEPATRTTITGTVVSHTANTVLVKSENGHYNLFLINRDTLVAKPLAANSTITVTSVPTDDPAVRLAKVITVVEPGATPPTAEQQDVVPESVRNAERAIQREAKKLHGGFQGGVALDPELIDIGVHAKFGPFFTRRLSFRPSVDFAYGEVTRMFGINLEMIYNLPFTIGARKYVYAGGGPAFNFVEQTFEKGQGVNFSDFHYDAALNLLLGIQHRSGLFTEMKASIYASPAPTLRLIVGYSF